MSKSVSAYHLCESSFEFLLPSFYSRLKSHGHTSLTDYLHNKSLVNLDGYNAAIHPLYGPLLDDVGYFFQICLLIESNLVYMEWIFSLVQPLIYTFILLFLLPLTIVIILFGCSFFCFYKKHWLNLKASISENNLWEATLKSICVFWEWHGALFHGHELVGAENFPKDGPALLIYYHGAMPTDFFYVHSKMVLYHNRRMRIVADNFLFKVPGLRTLLEVMEVTPGTVESCVSLLRQGNILAISPGGVREAFFSDHNYDIVWGNRLGFAKTACEAKVVSESENENEYITTCLSRLADNTNVYKELSRSIENSSVIQTLLSVHLREDSTPTRANIWHVSCEACDLYR